MIFIPPISTPDFLLFLWFFLLFTISILVAFDSYCYLHYATAHHGRLWISDEPLQQARNCIRRLGLAGYDTVTTNAIATANGVFSAGGAVGSLFMMWSCEAWGRKVNIQLGSFLAILGGVLQGGAANLKMFQAGRFVSGTSIGILVTVCPMYFAEMSSPFVRGWLVGHHAIFLVFGYMLSGWVGYGCYFATGVNPSFAWRFPLCLQILSPLLLLIGSPWLPRSPRWLISKGKYDEAWEILRRLRQSKDDPQDLVAKEEFYQSKEQVKLEAEKLAATGSSLWMAVLKKKSYRKRMIIGFLTQWGAEFGGPLIINNYVVILYTNLGMTGHMPLLLSALWLTTAGLIYNPLGAWLHDKVNSRRMMYIVGFVGIFITRLLLHDSRYARTTNRCLVTGTFLRYNDVHFTSLKFSLPEIRPIGMGFSLFGQFASTIILLQTAPIGFARVGWKYYLVVIIWSAFFIPVIYFFFPETARLSLEEIAKNFGEEVAVDITTATEEEKVKLEETVASGDMIKTGNLPTAAEAKESA
ncbi:low-affinity L-arabinose transport system proton symport protein [Coccidioides immitis H538.4]|uniref:Low-affinity L-arabinose transport system proton symport protein n=1 Tax=Coccidioides immitis H538.4 TaxID=396776 RepID=A0A0J8RGQ1_COCIT|nr:low-affinity L-arabinose transport system proton symport protein [Coccidioides immitis H538.4]